MDEPAPSGKQQPVEGPEYFRGCAARECPGPPMPELLDGPIRPPAARPLVGGFCTAPPSGPRALIENGEQPPVGPARRSHDGTDPRSHTVVRLGDKGVHGSEHVPRPIVERPPARGAAHQARAIAHHACPIYRSWHRFAMGGRRRFARHQLAKAALRHIARVTRPPGREGGFDQVLCSSPVSAMDFSRIDGPCRPPSKTSRDASSGALDSNRHRRNY